jgi:pyruvate dehydrogenase (quinone)
MPTVTVADFVVSRLHAWGVRRIYGYPGDGITGLMGALQRTDGGERSIEFVQVRHEEMAAFMACAHAKFTGEPGVCLATSGPGAVHLLTGLYDAKLDHQPVVALVGQVARTLLGSEAHQEVDLAALFQDVAAYVQTATVPEQVRHVVDQAFRIAHAERAVTCVILPKDVQELDADPSPPRRKDFEHSAVGYERPRVVPSEAQLDQAAEVLNAGERVALLIGTGARDAADTVLEVADRLGAGIAKALLGKDVLPDDLPFVTGTIGMLGTRASWQMMQHCDTLLMVGTRFPYTEFLPEEGRARGVQIDLDARSLGLRFPAEVTLHGDADLTLAALLPRLRAHTDTSWREKLQEWTEEWWRLVEARAHGKANPLNPQRVFWDLSPRLPDGSIVTGDAGTAAIWMARDLRLRRGMRLSLSGGLASMGSGVPYAIAAKFAHPDLCVVAAVGDGAMQMSGSAELLTVAKYWKRWQDPRLVVLVLNNGDLNLVTWEQRVLAGNPKYAASQDLPAFDYAAYARSLGLVGVRVDDPDKVAAAWDEVLSADRPAVLEAKVDPDVPPLPPHLTFRQASHYVAALLKGDPDLGGVLRQSWRELTAPLLP